MDAALEMLKSALATHDRCVRASILEGDVLTDRDEHERAIRAYQRVEEQDADYVPETIDRIQFCYRALNQPAEMDSYLNGLMARYGWITPMLALADLKREREGPEAAIEFISEQLRRRTSVRGLDRLLQLELEQADAENGAHVSILKDLTGELLADRPVYKCLHCGFPARLLHWQCPSCKHWNTIKPIQGVEGE
jgi:lipopolysaccharide biosynthesis regulator YciM